MYWIRALPSWVTGAVVGAVLAAGVLLWFWRPWSDRGPVGRVILTEPIERYDPAFLYQLPTPAPPDWRRTGEVVDCPVIEPDSRAARRELAVFGDDDLGDLLYLGELGDLNYGGTLRVRRPEVHPGDETPPLIAVDLRPSRPPLARWDSLHALSAQAGVTAQDGGIEKRLRVNYRPGEAHVRRRWSSALDVGVDYLPERTDDRFHVYALGGVTWCGGGDCR